MKQKILSIFSNKITWLLLGVILTVALIVGICVGISSCAARHDTPETTVSDTYETTDTTETTASEATQTTATTATETTASPARPALPDKVIALTFDDGPSLVITPQILDILEKYNAKATFFVVGSSLVDAKMNTFRRAIGMGCEIGNHSYNHSMLTELSAEEIIGEIRDTNERIAYLSCVGYTSTLLRPPGGHIDRAVMEALYADGIRMHAILWSDDSRDWEFNAAYRNGEISEEEAIERTCELLLSEVTNGGIVLMHDIKEITPAVLDRVLAELTAQGYTFVTVSELFDFDNMGSNAYFSKFYSRDRVMFVQ